MQHQRRELSKRLGSQTIQRARFFDIKPIINQGIYRVRQQAGAKMIVTDGATQRRLEVLSLQHSHFNPSSASFTWPYRTLHGSEVTFFRAKLSADPHSRRR
jgi:hypothetical protein